MAHPLAKFDQRGDFAAVNAAEAAARAAGFSIGNMQAHSPRGLIFGDVTIAKWRNLTRSEQLDLHGQMWGGRDAAVTIMLHADAPADAVRAFYGLLAAIDPAQGIAA